MKANCPLFTLILGLATFATFTSPAHGEELRILTDKKGQTIKAELISVIGEKVKIKREDGELFTLALSTLSESDQKKLIAWGKANPPKLEPKDLDLQYSRGNFHTDKSVPKGGGFTVYKEQWGYNITLTNKSDHPLENLHAAYILFVKQDKGPGIGYERKLNKSKGVYKIEPLPVFGKTTFRTDTILTYKFVLQAGYIWETNGSIEPIRDTLYGMWIRIYQGNQLVLEKIIPEDLTKTEKWPTEASK